mgnify:CR=1 FL=1
MSTGNDSILDAYLYETNTLLEQLDSIVLASEEKDTFSEEDINTCLLYTSDAADE